MKTPLMLSFLVFMFAAFFVTDVRKFIYITIFFVFFPIIIPFMGRDAISTGTISIFLLYLKYVLNSQRLINEKYDGWIYLLILLGTASITFPFLTGSMAKSQFGPAVRHYMGFLGAMLLFIVVKNQEYFRTSKNFEITNREYEKLLNFFLLLMSIHIMISIGIKYFPALGSVFKPFLSRDLSTLDIYGRGGIERVGTFVFSYESLAEILALLAPIILYKMFTRKTSWFFVFTLFCLGIVFTTTRSGILLFSFGVFISIIFHFKKKFGKVYALTYFLVSIVLLIGFYKPSSFADLAYRFHHAADTYKSGGSIIEVINRDTVFYDAWDSTLKNISIFGNGITEFNFHNLFLTIIHQMGIVGAAIFLCVLLYPLLQLIRNYPDEPFVDKSLFFSCLLSFNLFLINECKYEFNRSDSYQQICWVLIAIYYQISIKEKRYSINNLIS